MPPTAATAMRGTLIRCRAYLALQFNGCLTCGRRGWDEHAQIAIIFDASIEVVTHLQKATTELLQEREKQQSSKKRRLLDEAGDTTRNTTMEHWYFECLFFWTYEVEFVFSILGKFY